MFIKEALIDNAYNSTGESTVLKEFLHIAKKTSKAYSYSTSMQ